MQSCGSCPNTCETRDAHHKRCGIACPTDTHACATTLLPYLNSKPAHPSRRHYSYNDDTRWCKCLLNLHLGGWARHCPLTASTMPFLKRDWFHSAHGTHVCGPVFTTPSTHCHSYAHIRSYISHRALIALCKRGCTLESGSRRLGKETDAKIIAIAASLPCRRPGKKMHQKINLIIFKCCKKSMFVSRLSAHGRPG